MGAPPAGVGGGPPIDGSGPYFQLVVEQLRALHARNDQLERQLGYVAAQIGGGGGDRVGPGGVSGPYAASPMASFAFAPAPASRVRSALLQAASVLPKNALLHDPASSFPRGHLQGGFQPFVTSLDLQTDVMAQRIQRAISSDAFHEYQALYSVLSYFQDLLGYFVAFAEVLPAPYRGHFEGLLHHLLRVYSKAAQRASYLQLRATAGVQSARIVSSLSRAGEPGFSLPDPVFQAIYEQLLAMQSKKQAAAGASSLFSAFAGAPSSGAPSVPIAAALQEAADVEMADTPAPGVSKGVVPNKASSQPRKNRGGSAAK